MQSHHLHKYVLSKKKKITIIDRCMMVASAIYPFTVMPQIVSIYTQHNVEGISLVSWLGFMSFGTIFLTYALVHRIKPLIVSQVLWMVVDISVVVGVLMYR
jgi:uncharacterized protein with PQ loop repeat